MKWMLLFAALSGANARVQQLQDHLVTQQVSQEARDLHVQARTAPVTEEDWTHKFDGHTTGWVTLEQPGGAIAGLFRSGGSALSAIEKVHVGRRDFSSECVEADWSYSFDSAGQVVCPDNKLVTALYRTGGGLNGGLWELEKARCCGTVFGETADSDCSWEDWSTAFDSAGWQDCPAGKYITGFERSGSGGSGSDQQGIERLEKVRCCKPADVPLTTFESSSGNVVYCADGSKLEHDGTFEDVQSKLGDCENLGEQAAVGRNQSDCGKARNDGCSIPEWTKDIIFQPLTNPPSGTISAYDWTRLTFSQACSVHDICYARQGSKQGPNDGFDTDNCDDTFWYNLKQSCLQFPAVTATFEASGIARAPLARWQCDVFAVGMWTAVSRTKGGAVGYCSGQNVCVRDSAAQVDCQATTCGIVDGFGEWMEILVDPTRICLDNHVYSGEQGDRCMGPLHNCKYGMGCCSGVCTPLVKDWANIGWCPDDCRGAPTYITDVSAGTCDDPSVHWPRHLGDSCTFHTDCANWHGPNRCCGGVCTQSHRDWVGICWCPAECRGGIFSASGSCPNVCH